MKKIFLCIGMFLTVYASGMLINKEMAQRINQERFVYNFLDASRLKDRCCADISQDNCIEQTKKYLQKRMPSYANFFEVLQSDCAHYTQIAAHWGTILAEDTDQSKISDYTDLELDALRHKIGIQIACEYMPSFMQLRAMIVSYRIQPTQSPLFCAIYEQWSKGVVGNLQLQNYACRAGMFGFSTQLTKMLEADAQIKKDNNKEEQ